MTLEVINASFSYRRNSTVFNNIYFRAVENDVLCILGPNGCGKTTLLKCLSGILKLRQGDVRLDNRSVLTLTRSQIAATMGYIPQEQASGFAYSVLEVVLMGRTPHLRLFASPSSKDYLIAEESLEMVGITHLKDKRYTEISGGERQLVLIARTLTQQPGILLLDEPTSHLDFRNQTLILRLVKKLSLSGLSVIMTSHFPDQALAYAKKIALMHHGDFIDFGDPEEVITEKNLKQIYEIDVKIISFQDPATGELMRFCRAA